MLKNPHLALRLARFGFRDGWLYYRDEKGLFRFRALPRLDSEHLQAKDGWRSMDRVLRDDLIHKFWFDLHRHRGVWLLPCGDRVYMAVFIGRRNGATSTHRMRRLLLFGDNPRVSLFMDIRMWRASGRKVEIVLFLRSRKPARSGSERTFAMR